MSNKFLSVWKFSIRQIVVVTSCSGLAFALLLQRPFETLVVSIGCAIISTFTSMGLLMLRYGGVSIREDIDELAILSSSVSLTIVLWVVAFAFSIFITFTT